MHERIQHMDVFADPRHFETLTLLHSQEFNVPTQAVE